jgi:F0F1-type ATP synthase membrane subunit c/vacuolar-type H+-ATPase subunit K
MGEVLFVLAVVGLAVGLGGCWAAWAVSRAAKHGVVGGRAGVAQSTKFRRTGGM